MTARGSREAALEGLRAAETLRATGDWNGAASAHEGACEVLAALGLTVAHHDAQNGSWRFGHQRGGPAGTATLQLAGAMTLTVDLADPAQVVALTVPSPAAQEGIERARATVAQLIGPDAAQRFGRAGAEDERRLVSVAASPAPALAALTRLAALEHAREADEEQHGAWPLWAAEAAVLAARAAAVPGCDARARAEAATCARTVRDIATLATAVDVRTRLAELLPELEALAGSSADRLLLGEAKAAVNRGAADERRTWREWMRDLLPDLSAFTPSRVPALGWASDGVPRGEDARDGERPGEASGSLKIDPSLARYGVLPTPRAEVFWAEGATELEVRCFGREDVPMQGGVWLRAFRPPGFELLAAAPLAVDAGAPPVDGRRALVGRLELPPGLKEHQLELDITAAPAVPPRGSRMWTVLQATAAGQAALAAERSGWFDSAADLWGASAGNWEQAGELFQRVRAEAFKAQALDALTGRSGDELREELARTLPAAVWRLGLPRPHATAFLAEMARPAAY